MYYNPFKKKKAVLDPRTEAEVARSIGRQVSVQKAWLLLVFTVLACLVPILLGLRLWDSIPEMVETGLVKADGTADNMPRWALVFVLPGLFCVLNVINHQQLRRFQRKERIPPRHTLLLGRFGFPLLGLLFSAGFIPAGAGRMDMTGLLMVIWALGWAMMLLGGTLWECPPDSRVRTVLPPGLTDGAGGRTASVALLAAGLAVLVIAAILLTA